MKKQVETIEYLRLLEKWLKFSLRDIYSPRERRDLECYGTGYNEWGVQTNQKALAAWAVAGTAPQLDVSNANLSRDEILDHSLKMLRFSLETHKEGSYECLDGTKWGHTWITALGTERMMHAVESLEPHLTDKDKYLLRKVLISECDWLLDYHAIVANPDAGSGANNPENNLWNGALLQRTAMLYHDAPRSAEYRRKGTKFLLNSISLLSDATSEAMFDGTPLSEWHVGGNFFESYALHHHGYLNIGYMVICLSNIAMAHFSYKTRGIESPKALRQHSDDLWKLIKLCTFPDGRLCRIGGDTRARYCYCQDYALPMWLFVLDEFGDKECVDFERGWLEIVKKECGMNGDGSFLGDRGKILRRKSPLYYTRLESDRAATLSMAAYWRRVNPKLNINSDNESTDSLIERSWSDEFHGASLHRNAQRITSWVWEAAEKPQGLCVPIRKSDMAEWRTNLFPRVIGTGASNTNEVISHSDAHFEGGFSTFGVVLSKTNQLLAEGPQNEEVVAEQQLVFAALPDGATTICVQYAEAPHRVYIEKVQGLNLNMPNDIFNEHVRRYQSAISAFQTAPLPKNEETIELDSNWLMIDDSLFVEVLYGGNITIHRSAQREICIRNKERGGGFLYVDEISCPYENGLKPYDKGTVLVDIAFILRTGDSAKPAGTSFKLEITGDGASKTRCATAIGADGELYALFANFADQESCVEIPIDEIRQAVELSSGKTFEGSGKEIKFSCPPHSHILARLA